MIAIMSVFLHEAGHGLMVILFGGIITYFEVMPGLQLFPIIAWHHWSGVVASISYSLPASTPDFLVGVIQLMGSGMTACIALLALRLLVITRPRGMIRTILLVTAFLMPLDILTYSLFPRLGWRHWIFVGGTKPEPLDGAILMGIPTWVFNVGLGLYILLIYGVLAYILSRFYQDQPKSRPTEGAPDQRQSAP
jgi:hypothetical protein